MIEKKAIVIIILIVIIISILIVILYKADINLGVVKCKLRNGRIVNSLGEKCNENEMNIGEIPGYNCPCICCVPK